MPHFAEALRPIEWRYTNDPAWVMRDKGGQLTHNRVWMTAAGQMPDDPVLHAAALVYSSDTTVLDSIITTHGLSWGFDRIFAVTMNHSVWFHRPIRFDDWVLYSTSSPVAADSRGLGTGHFFDESGRCWPPSCRRASSSTSRAGYGVGVTRRNWSSDAFAKLVGASLDGRPDRMPASLHAVQVVDAADLVEHADPDRR